MSVWWVIVIVGAITFSERASFVVSSAHAALPPLVVRWMRFVPPAVLSAIIVPAILVRDSIIQVGPHNPRLLAALPAILVAVVTRNMLATIAAGMATLWMLQSLGF